VIIGFDYDGTLVKSWTSTPLPGVCERLAELPKDARTFIATNQAGPAFRMVLHDAKYPTVEDVAARIIEGLAALHWQPHLLLLCMCSDKQGAAWYRAEHHAAYELEHLLAPSLGSLPIQIFVNRHYRKPRHGMLAAGAWELRKQTDGGLTYIGDMDTDRQAATAAKCRYLDAADWRTGAALEWQL
jgi:hypothetical protein